MPTHGNPSAAGCFGSIDRFINKAQAFGLPVALGIPFRVGIGALPAISGSVFFPAIAPLFVLTSLAATYAATGSIQERLFEFSPKEKQWAITLPVHALFTAWAATLAIIDNLDQIGRCVGPLVLIAAVSIWPVYMGKKSYGSKSRKVPFKVSYALTGIIVSFQQTIIFLRRF